MIWFVDLALVAGTLFLQYMVINVLPVPFANVDLFLVLSGVYALKRPPVRAMIFTFFGALVMELVYPVASVTGFKTMAALCLVFVLSQLNIRLVLRGAGACLMVGAYTVAVGLVTRILAVLVGVVPPAVPGFHYFVLFLGSVLLTCLLIEKFDVQ